MITIIEPRPVTTPPRTFAQDLAELIARHGMHTRTGVRPSTLAQYVVGFIEQQREVKR